MHGIVIDTILNLLFRCAHRHLTRPFTPVGGQAAPQGTTYVVCLDCTKQFAYDLKAMRIGKAIDHAHDACVIPPYAQAFVRPSWHMPSGWLYQLQYCSVRR